MLIKAIKMITWESIIYILEGENLLYFLLFQGFAEVECWSELTDGNSKWISCETKKPEPVRPFFQQNKGNKRKHILG